jgi:hypothetical protein
MFKKVVLLVLSVILTLSMSFTVCHAFGEVENTINSSSLSLSVNVNKNLGHLPV